MNIRTKKTPQLDNKQSNQNIKLSDLVETNKEKNNKTDRALLPIDSSIINNEALLQSILDLVNKEETYNQISDQSQILNGYTLQNVTQDQVDYLVTKNREELAELKQKLSIVTEVLNKEYVESNLSFKYNRTLSNKLALSLLLHINNLHDVPKEVTPDIENIIEQKYSEAKWMVSKLQEVSNEYKDSAVMGDPPEVREEESRKLTTLVQALSYQAGEYIIRYDQHLGIPSSGHDTEYKYALANKDIDLEPLAKEIMSTKFLHSIQSILKDITRDKETLPKDLSKKNVGLIPLLGAAKDTKESLSFIEQSINAQDRQQSYIDTIFKNKTTIHLHGKDFTIENYLNGCFDCFFDGFKVGHLGAKFKAEYDIKEALSGIRWLLDRLSFALDIKYLIVQNFCSLARLGSLCPMEIAFLIANIIALIRFTWQSFVTMFGGKGFLFDLIGEILSPLLRALKSSVEFSFGPFELYSHCVSKSITRIKDIEKALPDPQYGWSISEIRAANEGNSPSNKLESRIDLYKQTIERGTKIEDIQAYRGNKIQKLTNSINEAFNAENNPDGNYILTVLSNPFLTGNTDYLDMMENLLKEGRDNATKSLESIGLFTKNFQDFFHSHSGNKAVLGAKLIALSTLLGILGALMKTFTNSGKEPCIKMPINNNGDVTLESPFTPEELFKLIEESGSSANEEPTIFERILIDNPGLKNGNLELSNPATNQTFSLINCNMAKESIISRGENLDFWKAISFGVDYND